MAHPYLQLSLHFSTPGRSELVESLQDRLGSTSGTPAGSRLPPVRVLAHQLGISRTTVQAAYSELISRGLVVSRERVGLFVAQPRSAAPAVGRSSIRSPALKKPDVSSSEHVNAANPRRAIYLSGVFIDPELLPTNKLRACYRSVLTQPGLTPGYHGRTAPPIWSFLLSN